MNTTERMEKLEETARACWGALLLADSLVDDPKVKAAFLEAHQKCQWLMQEAD